MSYRMSLVGSNILFPGSQTSDVDVFPPGNVAYLGSYVDMGVAVVDMGDRSRPKVSAVLSTDFVGPADGENASDSADVDVSADGSLLAVAHQPFDEGAFGGVSLWATGPDPLHPTLLGKVWTGGTHNVQIDPAYPRRPYVYAANFFSVDPTHAYHVSIIDASDPAHPFIVADYVSPEGQGCTNPEGCHEFGGPFNAAHDLTLLVHPATGHVLLYVAYWDSGLRIVDVTDPANPREIGAVDYTPGDGPALPWAEPLAGGTCCAHYAQPTPSGRYVLLEDELGVGLGGIVHIYGAEGCDGVAPCILTHLADWDPSPGRNVQASAIRATINTEGAVEPNGIFQRFFTRDVHNLDVREDRFLAAGYSNGVYLVDLSDPARPTTLAFYLRATSLRDACHGTNTLNAWGYVGDCFLQAFEMWGAKFGEPVPGSPSDFYVYVSDFWEGFLILRTVTR